MFMKLGKDEVLMAPYMHSDVLAISAQGRIQGRAKIGHGGPHLKKVVVFLPRRLQQQTECIAMILKQVGWSFVVFGSILMSNFWGVHCTQVSDSGPHGPLVSWSMPFYNTCSSVKNMFLDQWSSAYGSSFLHLYQRRTGSKLWHVKRCNIWSFLFILYNFLFVLYNFLCVLYKTPFILYNFLFIWYIFLFVLYNFHLYCIISYLYCKTFIYIV